jgi:hypothetical protein
MNKDDRIVRQNTQCSPTSWHISHVLISSSRTAADAALISLRSVVRETSTFFRHNIMCMSLLNILELTDRPTNRLGNWLTDRKAALMIGWQSKRKADQLADPTLHTVCWIFGRYASDKNLLLWSPKFHTRVHELSHWNIRIFLRDAFRFHKRGGRDH